LNIDDFVHPPRSGAIICGYLLAFLMGPTLFKLKLCARAPRLLCTWSMDVRFIRNGGRGRSCSILLYLNPRNSPLSTIAYAKDASYQMFRRLMARVIGPEVIKTRFATARNTIILNMHLLANDDAKTRLVSGYRTRFISTYT